MTTYHEGPFRNWLRIHFPSCPEELLSGLVDPQQPTMVEVVQEDGSTRQEFSRYWPKAGGGSQTDPRLSPTSLVNGPAGMYTGAMRGLVQDALGRGGGVGFGFRHARTHGVYTASDGAVWVVEISSDGVRAAPLPLCPFEAADTTAGISSSVRSFPSSSAVQIAAASVVAPAYGGQTPIWPECGWAFSASGSKAANVVIGQPAAYMVSYLYEITISETTYTIDGESVKGPGSATMALLESGFFWGDRVTHIRHPRYSAPQSLVSFDWFRGQITPPDTEFISPIHVHYQGEAMQVVRYEFLREDASEGSFTAESRKGGFASLVFPTVPTGLFGSGDKPLDRRTPLPANWLAGPGGSVSYTEIAYRYFFGLIMDQAGTTSYTELDSSGSDVLTLPFWDREGYYHVRADREVSSGTETATADMKATRRAQNHTLGTNAIRGARLFPCVGDLGVPADYITEDEGEDFVAGVMENHETIDAAGFSPTLIGDFLEPTDVPDPIRRAFSSLASGCGEFSDSSAADMGETWWDENLARAGWVFHDLIAEGSGFVGPVWVRRADWWIVRERRLSDDFVQGTGGRVRRQPGIWLKPSTHSNKPTVEAEYTYSDQPFSTDERENSGGILVGGTVIALDVDDPTWEEITIFDSQAQTQQRILLLAVDASPAGLRAHLTGVFPQQGTIGELLSGSGSYPYGSVTSTVPSWIGKP